MGGCIQPFQEVSLPQNIKPIQRIQGNLLARGERRLLTWLCARLPAWVKPDHLTTLGLVGAAMVMAGYAASGSDRQWLWFAIAGFFVHWFGDSLDQVSHRADGIGNLMIVGGLGLSPFVRLDVALLALAGYYLLSIHAFLAVRVLGELRLSYAAAGPTELRLALIALTIAMWSYDDQVPRVAGMSVFDVIVAIVAGLLIALFVIQTITTGRRITREGE